MSEITDKPKARDWDAIIREPDKRHIACGFVECGGSGTPIGAPTPSGRRRVAHCGAVFVTLGGLVENLRPSVYCETCWRAMVENSPCSPACPRGLK